MSEKTAFIRNLMLIGVLAATGFLGAGTPQPLKADGCADISPIYGDGCFACDVGDCWSITCPTWWAGDCE